MTGRTLLDQILADMFTKRELAALRRIGETVTVEYSPYWGRSWEKKTWHVLVIPRPVPNRGGWANYACGWIQGAPTQTKDVPRHDLRFMPPICPSCLSVLSAFAQTGVSRPIQARHGPPAQEVGLGCPSAKSDAPRGSESKAEGRP